MISPLLIISTKYRINVASADLVGLLVFVCFNVQIQIIPQYAYMYMCAGEMRSQTKRVSPRPNEFFNI